MLPRLRIEPDDAAAQRPRCSQGEWFAGTGPGFGRASRPLWLWMRLFSGPVNPTIAPDLTAVLGAFASGGLRDRITLRIRNQALARLEFAQSP